MAIVISWQSVTTNSPCVCGCDSGTEINVTPPFIITIILILLPRPASTAVGQISNWNAYKLCLFAHTAVNHRGVGRRCICCM